MTFHLLSVLRLLYIRINPLKRDGPNGKELSNDMKKALLSILEDRNSIWKVSQILGIAC